MGLGGTEREMIRGLLLGILAGMIGVAAGAYWYFSSGRAPVAVTAPEIIRPVAKFKFLGLGFSGVDDEFWHR